MKGPFAITRPAVRDDLVDQNQQDYSAQISRALSLQQRTPGRLRPTIGLQFQVDDFSKAEFNWLRRRFRFEAHVVDAAVAGQQAFQQWTGSPGRLIVIETVTFTNLNPGQQTFVVGIVTPEAGASGANFTMLDDRQYFGGAGTSIQANHGTAVAPVAAIGGALLSVGGLSAQTYDVGVALTGKTNALGTITACWKIVCQQPNLRTDVTIRWSERELLPTEV